MLKKNFHMQQAVLTSYLKTYGMYLIRFFSSSKISLKKDSRRIIFGQTKLNENNFTSRVCMWWAFEEIAPHAEEMAGEKDMGCCV